MSTKLMGLIDGNFLLLPLTLPLLAGFFQPQWGDLLSAIRSAVGLHSRALRSMIACVSSVPSCITLCMAHGCGACTAVLCQSGLFAAVPCWCPSVEPLTISCLRLWCPPGHQHTQVRASCAEACLCRAYFPAFAMGFGTSSSAATMPVTMECGMKLKCRPSIVKFVIPLGTNINRDGAALYEAASVLFIAQV